MTSLISARMLPVSTAVRDKMIDGTSSTMAMTTASGHLVLLVSHSSAGGAQEIWANLAEGLRVRGWSVCLCALYPFRAEVRETPAELPWTYIVPVRPTSPVGYVTLARALIRFFVERPASHLLTAMPAANVLGPLCARIAGQKTRCIISHHSPAETYNRVLNAVDGFIGAMPNVSTVVSVSEAVSNSLARKPAAYRAKRRTIYNALPAKVEQKLAALCETRRSRAGGRRVVATGRLSAQKNYPMLLASAALLADVDFDIVGSGPDEAELRRLALELGVERRVHFHGQRSREETLAVLAAADVFAQPSLYEGHSLALIEAAKLGLPLLVSDVPSQIEGVTGRDGQPCGVIVGVHDSAGLASAIRSLLDDTDARQQWSARSAHLAAGATFDVMLDGYQDLIGRPPQ